MKNFIIYLSTVPILLFTSISFLARFLIEINRFFPDALIFYFLGFLISLFLYFIKTK